MPTMAESFLPNGRGQQSPRTTELAPPRVAPRVRKTPTKHSPTAKSSPVATLNEGRSLLSNAPASHGTAVDDSEFSWFDRKTTPVDTDDSSLAVTEVVTEAPSHANYPEDEGSHAEDAWEQVQARSQGIKSRMLLSAKTAAEMKAAAAAAAAVAAAEKKPEPRFGRVVEILTSGVMCHATAEWLSPQNRASSSMDHQENDIVELSPAASADMQRSVASLTYTNSPKSQYVEEDPVPDSQHFTSEAAESFEEALSSAASSCSSSTGGALNSYSPSRMMNSDKSTAETAATLQTIDEDTLHQEKTTKRVLWKRLFRSKPQSDGADVETSLGEINTSSDFLDDIHLREVKSPNKSSHPDGESDQDFAAVAEEEETGVETVLYSSSENIEDSTTSLSTKLASIANPYQEEEPPLLGAVSSESSSVSKSSEEGTMSKTKDSLLRRVLKGSPSKHNARDDETASRKQSTLVSF